jgi:hypothetical protein
VAFGVEIDKDVVRRILSAQFLTILSVCLYLNAAIFRRLSAVANKRPACLPLEN